MTEDFLEKTIGREWERTRNERTSPTRTARSAKGAGNALKFNPHVAALPVYNAGMNVAVARARSGRDDIARLASNENPDGCSPHVMAALASAAFEPWRYADPACTALREELAKHLSVDAREIVVGNGSEEMIAAISRALLVEGASVVTVSPSFGLHEIEPLAMGAKVVKTPMTTDLGFDIDALVEAIAKGPRIVFVSSPWNPVGPALDRPALDQTCRGAASGNAVRSRRGLFRVRRPRHSRRGALSSRTRRRAYRAAHVLQSLRPRGIARRLRRLFRRRRLPAWSPPPRRLSTSMRPRSSPRSRRSRTPTGCKIRSPGFAASGRAYSTALKALGLRVADSQTNFVFFETAMDSSDARDRLAGRRDYRQALAGGGLRAFPARDHRHAGAKIAV